jgi:hypothetical protein
MAERPLYELCGRFHFANFNYNHPIQRLAGAAYSI